VELLGPELSRILRQLGWLCNHCPDGTTALCRRVLLFTDCGALAYNGTAFSAAEGANQADAEGAATSDLPGSSIVASACNDGGPQGKRTSY
jgi:hypothetical protein